MLDRQQYARFRMSPADPSTLRIADVSACLTRLVESSAGRISVQQFGTSFWGKPIFMARLGTGPRRVLLWSQMHGDEPTHTAVLLDLLSYLTRSPAELMATDIVSGCTLVMLPMLNPDGAEIGSRFNAQGIDVNRDARRLATPEGRALRDAVDSIRPEFAFNLHNQNARTSVGKPPRLAVASLLAPPPDERRTETDAMRRAKQVAACFVNAVRRDVDHFDAGISKYDDTFEPRAFGDWIQSTGAATVLVEAGGWPEADPEPLVRFHFHGLLTALHTIATGTYSETDPAVYESLPPSNETNLVDCMLTGGHIVDAERGIKYVADLAINLARSHRLGGASNGDARIIDVGDLSVLGGKYTINASNCFVLPGRVALLDDWNLGRPLGPERIERLLAAGITTAIGVVHSTNRDEIEHPDAVANMPLNWGFVVRLDSAAVPNLQVVERIALAVSQGALAIVGDRFDSNARRALEWLKVPLLEIDQLSKMLEGVGTEEQLAQQIWKMHVLVGLDAKRGRVGRDYVADLQLLDIDSKEGQIGQHNRQRLKQVIVGGVTIWENGKRTGATPGVLLKRG